MMLQSVSSKIQASLIVLTYSAAVSAASSQLDDNERVKTLKATGSTSPYVSMKVPRASASGVVYSQIVRELGTRITGIEIRLYTASPGDTWRLKVFTLAGELITTIDHAFLTQGFWRDATPPGQPASPPTFPKGVWSTFFDPQAAVRVEIVCDSPGSSPVLQLIAIALETSPSEPEGITLKKNELTSITAQSPEVRAWGTSVARIRFRAPTGKTFFCTGFLLAPDLLMTNYHCVQYREEMATADIDFGADQDSAQPFCTKLAGLEARDAPLDFAVFRLRDKVVGATCLSLSKPSAANPPQPHALSTGRELLIIQHPGGQSKQVSISAKCVVVSDPLAGWQNDSGSSDFGHQCDTQGASSGSPVQDRKTGEVIGLHHLTFTGADEINRAVHADLISAKLPPDLTKELENAHK